MEKVFYGEKLCQGYYGSGKRCHNKAYYTSLSKEGYFCGVHCKDRVMLPKDPNKQERLEARYKQHKQSIKVFTSRNFKKGLQGEVVTYTLRMMKGVEYEEGYLCVFPNFKHQNRKDGLGMSSLSPKSMGPIAHNFMKSKKGKFDVCKTLEAFHQSAKVFPSEVDENNNPTDEWYKTRKEMCSQDTPSRHKKAAKGVKGNKNIPLYSIWVDDQGNEKRFNYFQSRQFYCNIYERFALKDLNFKRLEDLLKGGTNIMLCGYDAYNPGALTPEEMYKDTSRPFGHEMVLYVMLTWLPEAWPWRLYKTEAF